VRTRIERVIGEGQLLAVGHVELSTEALLLKIGARQIDGGRSDVDAGDLGTAFREPREIDAGAAAHFDHPAAPPAVEIDEAEQMVQLLEMVLIEIVEEPEPTDVE
jgi:hypothetical protein